MHPLSDDQAFRRRKPTFRWNITWKKQICCFYPLVLLCHCQSVQRKSLMRTKERNVSLKLFQRVFAPAAVRDSEILAVRVEFCKEFLDFIFTHLKVQYLDKLISMYIIELNEPFAIELSWDVCYQQSRYRMSLPSTNLRTLQRNNKWETFLIKTFPLIPNTELSSK